MRSCDFFGAGPVLPVPDVAAAAAYYERVLGFAPDALSGDPPNHGSVTRGRVGIQFTRVPAMPTCCDYAGWTYVFVEHIDTLYAELQERGAMITRPLADHPHGMREFDVVDLYAHRLRFGQYR